VHALQLTYFEFAKEELEQFEQGMSTNTSSFTTSSDDSADETGQTTPQDGRQSGKLSALAFADAIAVTGMLLMLLLLLPLLLLLLLTKKGCCCWEHAPKLGSEQPLASVFGGNATHAEGTAVDSIFTCKTAAKTGRSSAHDAAASSQEPAGAMLPAVTGSKVIW